MATPVGIGNDTLLRCRQSGSLFENYIMTYGEVKSPQAFTPAGYHILIPLEPFLQQWQTLALG